MHKRKGTLKEETASHNYIRPLVKLEVSGEQNYKETKRQKPWSRQGG